MSVLRILFGSMKWYSVYQVLFGISIHPRSNAYFRSALRPALRSIKANVRKRWPTVCLISAVGGEHLQPIANGF